MYVCTYEEACATCLIFVIAAHNTNVHTYIQTYVCTIICMYVVAVMTNFDAVAGWLANFSYTLSTFCVDITPLVAKSTTTRIHTYASKQFKQTRKEL